jgi:hypothetical protein
MRPILTLIACLTGLFSFAQPYPQGTLSYSAAPELLFTEQSLSGTHRMGYGGSVKAEYVFAKHASATLTTGFNFLPAKAGFTDIQNIPVKPGIRYYLGSFYAGGEAGAAFGLGDNGGTAFAWSFGLGDKFHIGKQVFDIGLRHESWSQNSIRSSIIGLRVGYEWARQQR